jgi:hypothetical protein
MQDGKNVGATKPFDDYFAAVDRNAALIAEVDEQAAEIYWDIKHNQPLITLQYEHGMSKSAIYAKFRDAKQILSRPNMNWTAGLSKATRHALLRNNIVLLDQLLHIIENCPTTLGRVPSIGDTKSEEIFRWHKNKFQ